MVARPSVVHAMTRMPAAVSDPPPTAVEPAPLGGRRAVVEQALRLAADGRDGVLALVVATAGSTYRKPGALILLDAGGVRAGALSGGCLEAELERRAGEVLAAGAAGEALFDTSGDEDRVFGSGTGCGGSTRVLLLPLPAGDAPLRDALRDADRDGLPLTLRLSPQPAGAGEARVGTRRYRFDRHGRGAEEAALPPGATELRLAPPPRVLLLGAGPETRPLLRLTRSLGWRVELVEHRERWRRFADGSGIDAAHGGGPEAVPALLAQAPFDAALVMNHNYHLDARCLAHLANAEVGYVGLLGPATRRDELLAELGDETAARLQGRLHAPVGLPLGGEGAEAIALAIAAELQGLLARRGARA
jgi:xanthine dehydrogenase accessory factor